MGDGCRSHEVREAAKSPGRKPRPRARRPNHYEWRISRNRVTPGGSRISAASPRLTIVSNPARLGRGGRTLEHVWFAVRTIADALRPDIAKRGKCWSGPVAPPKSPVSSRTHAHTPPSHPRNLRIDNLPPRATVQFSRQVTRGRPIRHTRQQQRRRLELPKCLHHIATERFRRIEILAGVIPQQHAGDVPVLHPHIARGEHRHDDYHSDRGRHGRGWANPTDLELRRFFAHGDLRLVILRHRRKAAARL